MSLLDNVKNKDDLLYANQFHWFTGVIEDVNDPEQRGRYKVRCFGYHTERKDYVAASQLPWAHVMMPVTSASQCGVGESATGLLRGSWVVGFFRDGPSGQDPIIMGSLPSVTTTVDYDFGFCDPTEQYPYADKIDDPDTPEEAISKDDKFRESFSYLKKEEHRNLTPVPIALDGEWELPPVDEVIKVEYPKNHVRAYERKLPVVVTPNTAEETDGILEETPEFFEGDKGEEPKKEMHVQEFDVTPGWERISVMHSSGTYKEYTAVGDDHTVIVGDEYRIVVKNQHINVKGNCTITVEGNLHTLVEGNQFTHVKGNRIEQIDGNVIQTISGNSIRTIGMNEIRTIAMNSLNLTRMNKLDSVMMLRGEFTALSATETVMATKNTIVMGSNALNVGGLCTETVGEMKKDIVLGEYVNIIGRNRHEMVFHNSSELVFKEYLQYAGGNHMLLAGGALSSIAGGPNTIIGSPVTINGKFPMLFP